jgi:hypothetical protein
MRNPIVPLYESTLPYLRGARITLTRFENRRAIALLRLTVLGSSILLMLPGAWDHSATVVEFAQLPAGLAAWQGHTLGIYRVCGPLSKFLYALPAHLAGIRVDYPASYDSDVVQRQEWNLGRLFQAQHRERYHALYRWSRLLPMLVMVLGGCLVCEWSTRLFGPWPGVVSLCLWCWMPPILAHGSLVTSDMLSAVLLVAATRGFWTFLLAPRPRTALLAGLALGLAQSTKFTLLVLYPCWLLLLIGRALQPHGPGAIDPSARRGSPARLVAFGLLTFLISVFVIDALYLFQDVGVRLSQWHSSRSSLARDLHRLGEWRATAWLLQIPLPIPLEFFRGLDFQLADTERPQSAYLLGQARLGGWWYWYAAASLIKVPLPALGLFVLALFRLPGALRDRDPIVWAILCLLVPAAEVTVTIAATTGTGTNAAFRYLIPSLALFCVWAGRAWDTGSRAIRCVGIGLLAWLASNAIAGIPDHLGWQNELGWLCSRERPALLGDSLDWGQDLARLGTWVARHAPEGSTLVCVYGLGETELYGLGSPMALPSSTPWDRSTYLAISADILFGYEVEHCVTVAGADSSIDEYQRKIMLRQQPFAQVGRTIRIYRLRDLLPYLNPSPSPNTVRDIHLNAVE